MSKFSDFAKARREGTKMVPVPSVSIMPERDLGRAPALECLHLGIDFGGLKAVDDFNITVGRTEICGLIGPNGAGKTTVFNLLTKVYQPTRGTIMVDGQDTAGMSPARVNQMGVARTFQNIRLFAQLDNVRNNREYESLSKEIEFQNLDIQLNEKRIREAKEAIEHKNQEIERYTNLANERREDLNLKKSELDEIISETKAEEEKLREKVKNLELTIEPRLLTAFKRIRKNSRNGLGIVYVQRDACGGCFNKIPPQRQLDIRMRKKIIVCEYCGRIMIDPELAGVQVEQKVVEEKPKRRRRSLSSED